MKPIFEEKLGLGIDFVDWRNKEYPWHRLKFIVFGPVWDYAAHIDEFFDFVQKLKEFGISTLNSLDFIEWNLNKKYLLELKKVF